jgi:uncharacterized protein (DUF983 family)
MAKRSWFTALLAQRCPRCREGRIFRTALDVHVRCPVCGLLLDREPGYFIGAMYVSYGLALLILIPLFFFFQWLMPDASGITVATLSILPYLPLTLFVYRYSRVIWVYFDRASLSANGSEGQD